MDPIIQFIAFGLWTFVCMVVGAVLGYILRYTMERNDRKDDKPVCYGSLCRAGQGQCITGKGSKPPSRSSNPAQRGSTPKPRAGNTSDDDLNSNMGFEVMSDDAEPTPPVPETTMPSPPPVHTEPRPRANRHHYTERGNVPFYFTDTNGTCIHTRQNCQGLRTVAEGGRRVKPLETKWTCSWCCDGVMVIP